MVVDGEALFDDAVGVGVLLLEGQVCKESHLVSGQGIVFVQFNERFRQGLLEDHELIDEALEAVSAEVHRAADAAYLGRIVGIGHLAIQEEGGVVIGAVDSQHHVVPLAVRITVRYVQLQVFRLKERAVLIGFEPQHDRHVVCLRATEHVTVHLHAFTVQTERVTLLLVPSATVQIEGRTMRMIGHGLTLTFVHPVVSE